MEHKNKKDIENKVDDAVNDVEGIQNAENLNDYNSLEMQYMREMEEARGILEALQIANQKEKTRVEELSKANERLQIDFRNFKKRTEEQMSNSVLQGKSEAAVSMIGVLDVVYNAMDMIQDKAVKDGVSMIAKKMESVLYGLGINEIDSLYQSFDPELHNALMRVEVNDNSLDGKVVEVLQKGYSLANRVIRHAQVKVGYVYK